MRFPVLATSLVCLFALAPPARSQENVRTLEGSGTETKYLTPNGRDIWKIEVDAGETLVVHITTRDFDPVLRLVAPGEVELLRVDDEGSESRFAQRVQKSGLYRIVVHGFEERGGGNYQLAVRELRTRPVKFDAELVLDLDREGKAHCRFEAARGDVVVPVLAGQVSALACLDPSGAPLGEWMRTFRAEEDGEHILSVNGRAGTRLRLRLERARRSALPDGDAVTAELRPGEMHIHEMSRSSLDFRVLELTRREGVLSRLVCATPPDARALRERGFDLRALPIQSKGYRERYASVYGRDGRYELQVLSIATTPREYRLSAGDPSLALASTASTSGKMAVGGSDFYRFEAQPGQLFSMGLSSGAFDGFLRLYDGSGRELASDDDAGRDLDASLAFLAREQGTYRLQISSRGDGGGGVYELTLTAREIPTLPPEEVVRARLGEEGPRYWHFEGRAGQTVLLSVRSEDCDPSLEVLGPDGVVLGRDQDGGVERNCLLPLRLNRTGRHTFRVSVVGEGECELQLIPLD